MPVKISWPLVIGIVHPNIGGWLGGFITRKNINPWYESLKKPSWTPPKWIFAPVWTSLYCSMGYASYLVYSDSGGFEAGAFPLSIYGINLALNWAWTPLFFGAHQMKLALFDIILLWGSTVALSISFYRINHLAGCLILPYLAWNTLATALNYVLYRDNQITAQNVDKKK